MQMIALITPTETQQADPNKKSRVQPERHGNACFWP